MADPGQTFDGKPTTVGRPLSFLHLPGEIRNAIYQILLLQSEPIVVWPPSIPHYPLAPWIQRYKDPTGLFRVNKTVHREATPIFYGQNRFHLGLDDIELALFFQLIGTRNASSMRHIIIDFPEFFYTGPGNVSIEWEDINILGHINSNCTRLTTLETTLDSTRFMGIELGGLDNQDVAVEALNLVDNRFRALLSPPEIILNVYENEPLDFLRRASESYGWTLRKHPRPEKKDWGTRLSDADSDEYEYGYWHVL